MRQPTPFKLSCERCIHRNRCRDNPIRSCPNAAVAVTNTAKPEPRARKAIDLLDRRRKRHAAEATKKSLALESLPIMQALYAVLPHCPCCADGKAHAFHNASGDCNTCGWLADCHNPRADAANVKRDDPVYSNFRRRLLQDNLIVRQARAQARREAR